MNEEGEEETMGEFIIGVLFIGGWIVMGIVQTAQNRAERQYHLDKAQELSMKGETEASDRHLQIASSIKTLY